MRRSWKGRSNTGTTLHDMNASVFNPFVFRDPKTVFDPNPDPNTGEGIFRFGARLRFDTQFATSVVRCVSQIRCRKCVALGLIVIICTNAAT